MYILSRPLSIEKLFYDFDLYSLHFSSICHISFILFISLQTINNYTIKYNFYSSANV